MRPAGLSPPTKAGTTPLFRRGDKRSASTATACEDLERVEPEWARPHTPSATYQKTPFGVLVCGGRGGICSAHPWASPSALRAPGQPFGCPDSFRTNLSLWRQGCRNEHRRSRWPEGRGAGRTESTKWARPHTPSATYQKTPFGVLVSGGRGGIRTHGWLPIAGFQDRCNRPLCHPSDGCCLAVRAAGANRSQSLAQVAEAAHIGQQHFGYGDRAVGVLVVLHHRDQGATDGHA